MKKPWLSPRLLFRDPAGARTQDPNIKSVVLYQLSYRIIFQHKGTTPLSLGAQK